MFAARSKPGETERGKPETVDGMHGTQWPWKRSGTLHSRAERCPKSGRAVDEKVVLAVFVGRERVGGQSAWGHVRSRGRNAPSPSLLNSRPSFELATPPASCPLHLHHHRHPLPVFTATPGRHSLTVATVTPSPSVTPADPTRAHHPSPSRIQLDKTLIGSRLRAGPPCTSAVDRSRRVVRFARAGRPASILPVKRWPVTAAFGGRAGVCRDGNPSPTVLSRSSRASSWLDVRELSCPRQSQGCSLPQQSLGGWASHSHEHRVRELSFASSFSLCWTPYCVTAADCSPSLLGSECHEPSQRQVPGFQRARGA